MSADNSMNISAGGDGFSTPSTSRPVQHRGAKTNECVTQCEPIVLSQLWTIESFHTIMKLSRPGQCFRSQVFREAAMPDACWQLCLYPNGKREENANHVSLFLKMSATSPSKEVLVKAEYRFYFLDENDQPRFSNVNIGDFHAKPPKGGHSWGLRNIPKQKVANCVRTDGALVISCVIELMPDINRVQCRRVHPNPTCLMIEVSKQYVDEELDLLKTGETADCAIEVQGNQIRAHKQKLMAHSSVFKAMFSHGDLREAKEGIVKMESSNVTAVRLMLEYMYAGRLNTELTREDSVEVMILAEKYDIAALKVICELDLINTTTRENVCDSLIIADYQNAPSLMSHCVDLCISQKNFVMKQDSWKKMKDENPALVASVLERMVQAEQSPPPMKRSRI